MTIWVLVESAQRLVHGNPEIHGLPVFIIAAVSTLAMFVGAFILGRGAGNEDLHMRSVLLDTISDGLSAAAVSVVGGIIYFTGGLYWLDSATAILVGIVIGFGAVRLLRDVVKSLKSKQPLELGDD